jgi:hypothetical protein
VQSRRPERPGPHQTPRQTKGLAQGARGYFELPFEGTFAGAAKKEKRQYWLDVERADEVIIPDVEGFEEANKETGAQSREATPPGTALEGLLLPQPPGKDYRLLKVLTQPTTPDQFARWGNDRAPVIHEAGPKEQKRPA